MNEEKPTHTPTSVRYPSTNYGFSLQLSTSVCHVLFLVFHHLSRAREGFLSCYTNESGEIYCFCSKNGNLAQTSVIARVPSRLVVNGSLPFLHPQSLHMLIRNINPHWFILKISFNQASTLLEKLTNYFAYAFENITCI